MIEMKVGLVKEGKELTGAFVMIVPDNGIPMILGSVDEPLEIVTMSKDQLMGGLHALPQEFLMTADQNSAYESPETIEELQEMFMELVE